MTTGPNKIDEAVQRILDAYKAGEPCEPVRDLLGTDDIEAAYAVQRTITNKGLSEGRRLVGRKIGLTSPAVQQQLGVDQPDYGMLFADMDAPAGIEISPSSILQPKIEAEIAFVLKNDLNDEQLTSADVIGAIDYAVAALEIVGSRIRNWDISFVDTVADNASSGLFVLGSQPVKLDAFDVINCKMEMKDGDGEILSQGMGAACLGSPLTATRWLAQVMTKVGRPLRKGDIVLSGALGPMTPVEPGRKYIATIEGLGEVSASFSEA